MFHRLDFFRNPFGSILRQAQNEFRECLSAEALAKAGETSPLGSLGASIEANGGKNV
jgi:hypothetical protein